MNKKSRRMKSMKNRLAEELFNAVSFVEAFVGVHSQWHGSNRENRCCVVNFPTGVYMYYSSLLV